VSTLINDLRFAVRMLGKKPGFTLIALVTLAIGIGANTMMFTVVNALLLRPPKVKDADELVVCKAKETRGYARYRAYQEVQENGQVFAETTLYDADFHTVTLVWGQTTRTIQPMFVASDYFSFLGVRPAMGRTFLPAEERSGAEPVAILSHQMWRKCGADPNVVGSQVSLNGTFFRVVGVAPEQFTGATLVGPDLWLPMGTYGLLMHLGREKPERYAAEIWDYPTRTMLMGRLKPDLSLSAAQAQLQALMPMLKTNYPRWLTERSFLRICRAPRLSVISEEDDRKTLSRVSLFLMGVSGVVLLIACLNLANMMVIQGMGRHREIAIRMAIGGSRLRIIRQLFVEALLLAIGGGGFGLLLAFWGSQVLNVWMGGLTLPLDLAGALRGHLDVRVLGATLGLCLVATVLFGLKPALHLSRRDIMTDIKESAGSTGPSRSRRRFLPRGLSVVGQIALSVILVMGATLFTRSAVRMTQLNPGFRMDNKLLVEIEPLAGGYDLGRSIEICQILPEQLAAVPGIEAASTASGSPLGRGGDFCGEVRVYAADLQDNKARARPRPNTPAIYRVGRDYFKSIGLILLQGRAFRELDGVPDAEKVTIVDEKLARRLWPNGDALGGIIQRGWMEFDDPRRVVGIVPHLQRILDDKTDRPQMYEPLERNRTPCQFHLLVADSAVGNRAALSKRIRAEIQRIAPEMPVLSIRSLADHQHDNTVVSFTRFGAKLALTFGAMALFLAGLGIYAVKGYMVASRIPEIGIRKALGATAGNIMGLVFREGLIHTVAGLVVGLLLGLGATRLVNNVLYGVDASDPASIVATLVLLALASFLAAYFPARRAARIDPMEALRYE